MLADGSDCPVASKCNNKTVKCWVCDGKKFFSEGNPSRTKGAKHEKKITSLHNQKASLRPGSGAMAQAKGDVISPKLLIEAKSGYAKVNTKGKKTFTIEHGWLVKIVKEAKLEGKIPVLEIHFDGTPDEETYTLIPGSSLRELVREQGD